MLCARVGAELRVIPSIPTVRCNWRRCLRCLMRKPPAGNYSCLQRAWHRKSTGGMITLAHQHGAKVLVDGAQAVCIIRWMFRRWIATFTCSPGKTVWPHRNWHSLCERSLVAGMPPWEGGGSMIATVSLSEGTPGPKHHGGLKPVHPIPGASWSWRGAGVCFGAGA